MKKYILTLALCTIALPYTAQGAEISVDYNGVCMDDQMKTKPFFKQDRIFLGVRDIATLTGSQLTWDEARKTAHFETQEQKNSFSAGSKEVTILKEGETTQKNMDVCPEMVGDRLYVPIGFAKELGHLEATWNPKEQKLILTKEAVIKKIPITYNEGLKKVTVTETIPYDRENENIDAIVAYIQRTFDENFDVNQFLVRTNDGDTWGNHEVVKSEVWLRFLEHGFLSDAGYFFAVEDGVVTKIQVTGSPLCSEENKGTINEDGVDAKELLEEAAKKHGTNGGYTTVEAYVKKQYDTEPFYRATFLFRSPEFDIGHLESYQNFEFRNEGGAWVLQKEERRPVERELRD